MSLKQSDDKGVVLFTSKIPSGKRLEMSATRIPCTLSRLTAPEPIPLQVSLAVPSRRAKNQPFRLHRCG